jgi:MSHA biogenesis protein MshM
MYKEHFKLRETPFSLTPDTSYYFNNAGHQQALNVLLIALRSGEGFVKITGEVGTGKTLLCRKLINALEDTFVSAYLPNPLLAPRELLQEVARELGMESSATATGRQLLHLLTAKLLLKSSQGERMVICIDESQAMPERSLEALRLLSNLETEKNKLLQIVLFGQPELNERLAQPSLRQLRQRITFSYHLQPLGREELAAYVNHRLLIAGHQGGNLFRPQALQEIYRASHGIPRLVNILCHKTLMVVYGQGGGVVEKRQVQAAVRDTEGAEIARRGGGVRWSRWLLGLLGATPVVMFLLYLVREVSP